MKERKKTNVMYILNPTKINCYLLFKDQICIIIK